MVFHLSQSLNLNIIDILLLIVRYITFLRISAFYLYLTESTKESLLLHSVVYCLTCLSSLFDFVLCIIHLYAIMKRCVVISTQNIDIRQSRKKWQEQSNDNQLLWHLFIKLLLKKMFFLICLHSKLIVNQWFHFIKTKCCWLYT